MKNFKGFEIQQDQLNTIKAGNADSGGPGVDSFEEFKAIIDYLEKNGHGAQAKQLIGYYAWGYYDF